MGLSFKGRKEQLSSKKLTNSELTCILVPNLEAGHIYEWGFGKWPWTLTAKPTADSGIYISLGRHPCFVADPARRTQKAEHLWVHSLGLHDSTCSELILRRSRGICAGKDSCTSHADRGIRIK